MLKNRIQQFFKKNFIIIKEEYWADLQFKMLVENIFKVKSASIIALAFMAFLLFIDVKRFQNGLLIKGSIYWSLFILHLSIILHVIPLLLINLNKEKIRSGAYKYSRQIVMLWIVIVAGILLVMAALSILDRGSILLYALYIMLVNFVLILFHPDRAMLNIVSFIVFMIMVYLVHPYFDITYFIYFLETFAITFMAFSLSTHTYNMMVKEVTNENKLLEQKSQIEKAQAESNRLLLNILPATVAEELIKNDKVQPRNYTSATVMMIDFVGFSRISSTLSSEALVQTLDYSFTAFDRIIKKYGVEKIKTIGDGYLCVGGIPTETEDHPQQVILAAFEILDFLQKWKTEKEQKNEPYFEGRIGIHTGALTAGVVGETKFAYDIWGDTVNVAARLEAGSEAGKINISKTTFELIKDKFQCQHRGALPIKNLGTIEMYFVEKTLV